MLAGAGHLAQGTSSASTKLFHGGLRYLVLEELSSGYPQEALEERETLLTAMPQYQLADAFVLPVHPICDSKTTRQPRVCWGS